MRERTVSDHRRAGFLELDDPSVDDSSFGDSIAPAGQDEPSSVMDYESLDMPLAGDLDILESVLSTAACQAEGDKGDDNSSGQYYVLAYLRLIKSFMFTYDIHSSIFLTIHI